MIEIAVPTILTAKDVASILKKATKWVYNHADELNGRKIGGSLFFTMEGVYDAIQRSRTVARGYKDLRKTGGAENVQIEKRRSRMGKEKREGTKGERAELAIRAGLAQFL